VGLSKAVGFANVVQRVNRATSCWVPPSFLFNICSHHHLA